MHNFVSQHCWQSAWKKWRHLTQVLRRVGGQLGLIHQLLARSWEWCFRTEEHLGEGGLHCCFCFRWSFVAGGGDWLLSVGCSLQRLCRSSWFFPLRRCWSCCRSSSPLTWSPPPRLHLKEKNCENWKYQQQQTRTNSVVTLHCPKVLPGEAAAKNWHLGSWEDTHII